MSFRQLAVDVESTGLNTKEDRIIELGAVEMVDGIETGNVYNVRIRPNRPIAPDASAVHGIYDGDLVDCPEIQDVMGDFLAFLGDAELIIHNGLRFDVPIINSELARCGLAPLKHKVVDTWVLAQRKLGRGARLNLDALADRYGVDRSARTLHGALVDCSILARVYLAMTASSSDLLSAPPAPTNGTEVVAQSRVADTPFMPESARHRWFPERAGVVVPAAEIELHNEFLAKFRDPLWKTYLETSGV